MASLEHWTKVNVLLFSEYGSGRRIPNGFLPDPPGYQECIRFLATRLGISRPDGKGQRAKLKHQCGLEHHHQEDEALNMLIVDYWVHDEAARNRVTVSDEEIAVEAAKLRLRLPRHTRAAGMRVADAQLVIGTRMLLDKLYERLPISDVVRRSKTVSPQLDRELDVAHVKLDSEMVKRLTPETYCRSPFVVAGCSEYPSQGT